MGEAKILLRDAADLTAAVPAEVERKLHRAGAVVERRLRPQIR